MSDPIPRRRFLGGVGVGGIIAGAGCLSRFRTDSDPGEESGSTIEGIIVDRAGEPIADATIEALRTGSEPFTETTTDGEGRFAVDADVPAWIRASHPDYASRVRATGPGEGFALALSTKDGTVSLGFGGDVMFARRFYDQNPDPLSPRFRIDPDERLADHREVLSPIVPLLESVDVASVNLETPLTTADWTHPEKPYTFTSHPVTARALADAGVDYTAIGNNHVFDALEPGLTETTDVLDEAAVSYSGAGSSSEEAWEPAYIEQNGVSIAFLSCATVVGESYDIDWSADRDSGGQHAVEQGGETLTMPAETGVAEPTPDRLHAHVSDAAEEADVVVVQIHGGEEYQRTPTDRIEDLTHAAADAGADVVANHHPHVTGGVEYIGSTLVAWTLGNLVFDQELWETLRSYVLTVEVNETGVEHAAVEPALIEGYRPKGVVGEVRESLLGETAGLSSDRFVARGDALESSESMPTESRTASYTLDGNGAIYSRGDGWITDVGDRDGSLQLGRDRLPTGGFEDGTVNDRGFEGPLWRYGRNGSSAVEPGIGYEGGGIRLERHGGNEARALLSPRHRLPVDDDSLTVTGLYAYGGTDGLELLVSWYDDTAGSSITNDRVDLTATDGDWERITQHLEPPTDAEYVDLFFFLEPPETGERTAWFDELRLIEWADPEVESGREYDHLRLESSATVEFRAVTDTGSARIDWNPLRG